MRHLFLVMALMLCSCSGGSDVSSVIATAPDYAAPLAGAYRATGFSFSNSEGEAHTQDDFSYWTGLVQFTKINKSTLSYEQEIVLAIEGSQSVTTATVGTMTHKVGEQWEDSGDGKTVFFTLEENALTLFSRTETGSTWEEERSTWEKASLAAIPTLPLEMVPLNQQTAPHIGEGLGWRGAMVPSSSN